MKLKSAFTELDRKDLQFLAAQGWLAALATGIILFVNVVFD